MQTADFIRGLQKHIGKMKSMEKPEFDSVQITLFGLLAEALFGYPYVSPENTDWERVFRESYLQGVHMIAFQHPERHGIPSELQNRFKAIFRKYAMRNLKIGQQHTVIHRLMTEHNIPYCILKGLSSADYYPDSFLRGLGDVDFLVHREDFEIAEQILLESGFEKREGKDTDYHTVYDKNGCKFEMHRDFAELREESARAIVHRYRDTMIRESIRVQTNGNTYMSPSQFHHGLILLLHTQQHLLAEGIGLRHLCDWAVFVHSFPEDEFVQLFRDKLQEIGLWRFAQILSLSSSIAIKLPEKPWMDPTEKNKRIAASLLLDFLDGGNFGVKDQNRNRVYESKLYKNREKGQVYNAFASLNDWVRGKWPWATRCPILLPIGWVYFVFHRSILVIKGERKHLKLGKTVENSQKRKKIYRELKLFQPES